MFTLPSNVTMVTSGRPMADIDFTINSKRGYPHLELVPIQRRSAGHGTSECTLRVDVALEVFTKNYQ